MKLTVIGTGYVGLVTGTLLADFGNDVIGLDIDEAKVNQLQQGKPHFYERGLDDLLKRNIKQDRLRFTTDTKEAIQASDVLFICVGTPQGDDGKADLSAVKAVARDIGDYMDEKKTVVIRSTVPVGTNERVKRIIEDNLESDISFHVVSNPEFMREGAAVKDFQNPDRVIVGTRSDEAEQTMRDLFRHVTRVSRPFMATTPETAEIIKYASNSMLAARISFMNELSHLCEDVGADIKQVAKGMGLDDRIGPRFLQAGVGYGGSCFPKDVRALAHTLEKHNCANNILRAIDHINERQKKSLIPKLERYLPDLDGKTVAVWGLSFKPRTSDTRNAPALTVIDQLLDKYATVKAYDPEAMEEARDELPSKVEFADTALDALRDADALILCTEWDEFREPNFDKMQSLMRQPIVIDGRNVYDPDAMKQRGFTYQSVGR
jgi:UDPglucose 6-dehydrogenase